LDANTLSLSGGGFGCNDEDNPATPTEDGTDGGPGEGTDSEDEHPRYDTDAPATPMNIPVPNNRLVAFTLAGALLTTVVAAGLAFPGLGFATTGDTGNAVSDADASTSQQLAGDAPAPNQNFTPAVQTQSGYTGCLSGQTSRLALPLNRPRGCQTGSMQLSLLLNVHAASVHA